MIEQPGSHCHTTFNALTKVGMEHGPASKFMSKLHEHSVLTFCKILTSRRVLKGEDRPKLTEQSRSTLALGVFLSTSGYMVIAPGCHLRRLLLWLLKSVNFYFFLSSWKVSSSATDPDLDRSRDTDVWPTVNRSHRGVKWEAIQEDSFAWFLMAALLPQGYLSSTAWSSCFIPT